MAVRSAAAVGCLLRLELLCPFDEVVHERRMRRAEPLQKVFCRNAPLPRKAAQVVHHSRRYHCMVGIGHRVKQAEPILSCSAQVGIGKKPCPTSQYPLQCYK